MKKIITIVAFVLCALCANAQEYDRDFKYSLFSNVEIGAAGIYSHGIESKTNSIGAQFRMTKRLGTNWRLRGIASVNGFSKIKGFDRYGKGMIGISADFLPFYLFVDEGVVFNPSASSKFGLAIDGGIGLQFKLGSVSNLFIEGSIDRVNNGNLWQSNAGVMIGYSANLGVTNQDEKEINQRDYVRNRYGELAEENRLIKTEVNKMQEASKQMQEVLDRCTSLCEQLSHKLETAEADKEFLIKNCGKKEWCIYFNCGSAYISEQMDDVIADIAEEILQNKGIYGVNGYASNNGSVWRNLEISKERAEAVYERLIEYGISPDRLVYVGNGSTDYDRQADQKVIVSLLRQ